jgi:pimeloyl-ACP methyl ester carboxylesterase
MKDSLLPYHIVEKNQKGMILSDIHFHEPWLDLNGRPVPGKITCVMPRFEYTITYEFTIRDGVWIIDTVFSKGSVESLNKQSKLTSLEKGDIDEEMFVVPTDVELPEHSDTDLAPGERIVSFTTHDGLTLEGKLSLPPDSEKPVPVVFFLPGAGPFTFDRPVEFPDLSKSDGMFPEMKVVNYFDFYTRELNQRGIGFFRINKRGCAVVKTKPYERVNRKIFSQATPSVLLKDYQAALEELRTQPDIDPDRIILLGASEGTAIGARLALGEGDSIAGLAMMGYAEDNARDTIRWQQTTGRWRNLKRIFDENDDDKITKEEFEKRLKDVPISLTMGWSFEQLDTNKDNFITPQDTKKSDMLKAIENAYKSADNDFLWQHLLNLTTEYLAEEWDRKPTHTILLKLDIPLAIFHGDLDGSCRVEGVVETAKAFQKDNKDNLTVNFYSKTDHDLNWASFLKTKEVPPAFNTIFAWIEKQVE